MTMFKPIKLPALALLLAGLAGCYLPARFDAEIEIGKTGYYNVVFEGYLAEVNLYDAVHKNRISKAGEEQKVANLKADFMRDSATKEFEYFKMGHFKVKWEKEGDLLRSKMVSFVRRNENMFSISYNKEQALVTMRGTPISKLNAKRLTEAGLGMQGELRVKTDARVIKHNAGKVKDGEGRQKIYIWTITSPYDPAPSLTFNLR